MKDKDDIWLDQEVQKIKKKKRTMCKSISSFSYGTDFMAGKLTNKKIKEMKESLKKERRAAKRSNKQFWDKIIDEEVKNFENKK